MSAGPRWITAAEVETENVSTYQITTVLTDAQIKSAPTSRDLFIIPATEVLDYTFDATTLPIPELISLKLDSTAAAYTNLDSLSAIQTAWGRSDWNVSAANSWNGTEWTVAGTAINLFNTQGIRFQVMSFPMIFGGSIDITGNVGNLKNNGLVLTINNASAGDLTGGNAANTLTVTTSYKIYNFTTGTFV